MNARRYVSDAEWINGLALLWWCWSLLPSQHAVFGHFIAFDDMARVASQRTWGGATLLLLVALVTTTAIGNRRAQMGVLVCCTALWAFIAAMLYVTSPINTGTGVYAALAILTGRRYARLAL